MEVSEQGLAFIKDAEGFKGEAYLCPAGKWTIGYGHTEGVTKGMSMDEVTASKLLQAEVNASFAQPVEQALADAKVTVVTQEQFDAMVSLAYNIGVANFKRSSVLRELAAGHIQAAADHFLDWNKISVISQGVVEKRESKGLTARRMRERELFLSQGS